MLLQPLRKKSYELVYVYIYIYQLYHCIIDPLEIYDLLVSALLFMYNCITVKLRSYFLCNCIQIFSLYKLYSVYISNSDYDYK